MLWCACFDDLILNTNCARIGGKVYKYGLACTDDFTLLSVPEHSERAIKETFDIFKNKKLEVNKEKSRSTDTRFMDKTRKITLLSQEFGKQAEPQTSRADNNECKFKKKFNKVRFMSNEINSTQLQLVVSFHIV
ncbi:Hypothetical_protein [Hexamita inflata]|uniref:Hypothetical_protein n=1 Tax=Hexamita inflata TaxID=28002 RepID=A0AA86RJY4_9EUKA|nr:Hypothetical protein HINF_LOCUS62633 [Hexamita inflata]